MIEILELMLSGFWPFIGSCILCIIMVNGILNIYKLFVKMIIIIIRGWPSKPDVNIDVVGNENNIELDFEDV